MQTQTAAPQIITLERRKVYDPVLRLIHWILALSVIGLALSGFVAAELVEDNQALEKAVWTIHIWLGWALSASLVARVVWGVVGPQHARWREMWQPRVWWASVRRTGARSGEAEVSRGPRWGHDAVASAAYLGLWALVAAMVGTGIVLAAAEHNAGPLAAQWLDRFDAAHLLEEVHELAAWLILGFVATHVGAMIWHEWREGRPVAQSMVSGYQYQRVSRSLVLVAAAALISMLWQGQAMAQTPQDMLKTYAQAAGSADFSAVRGRAFYEQVIDGDRSRSCSSCHTPDPRAAGTSAAGKRIEPMAGNTARFTDPKQVEKWFRRNCNDVLARACTPTEKGDFITYILSR